MKMYLSFAEVHTAIFLNGLNLGLKLDPKRRIGLSLVYNRPEKELLVTVNGVTAIVPTSNVCTMIVDGSIEEVKAPKPAEAPVMFKGKVKAQVSTPTSHVFKDDPEAEKN